MSHVVGVLQIFYLLSCVGGWLSQHDCVEATAILFEVSFSVPCLTVQTKGLPQFKQRLVSYGGELYKRTLNYQGRYFNMLNNWKEYDCRYVTRNYSVLSEDVNEG